MPRQKRGKSRQDYGTPREFLDAVEKRFGKIALDLAANASNHVADLWFGPGSNCPDSLGCDWTMYGGLKWLNPPFANIAAWARKCVEAQAMGMEIAMLVPAAVGSNWFAKYVDPNAYVMPLSPRLTFVGETHSYPKDLMLCYFNPARLRGFEPWRWRP